MYPIYLFTDRGVPVPYLVYKSLYSYFYLHEFNVSWLQGRCPAAFSLPTYFTWTTPELLRCCATECAEDIKIVTKGLPQNLVIT